MSFHFFFFLFTAATGLVFRDNLRAAATTLCIFFPKNLSKKPFFSAVSKGVLWSLKILLNCLILSWGRDISFHPYPERMLCIKPGIFSEKAFAEISVIQQILSPSRKEMRTSLSPSLIPARILTSFVMTICPLASMVSTASTSYDWDPESEQGSETGLPDIFFIPSSE